jgi:pimeloyl-ACP methyl ester carboxylesterase
VSERRPVDDDSVRRPTRPGWSRGRIVLALYIALLALSGWVRAGRPGPPPEPGERRVDVDPRHPDTPLPDAPPLGPATIAFARRCPPSAIGIGPASAAASSGTARPPAVVLLHGSPGTRHDFDGVLEALARDRCAIAPDLPGFGQSTRGVPDYSVRAHADYVEALLDALGEREVHVVGFSMGGGVAIALADQAPKRVRSLTLLSGLGVQEQELFGRYAVNHAVHGVQLAVFWLATEAVPHFGWFDDAFMGIEYARNFYDTDQRPLRPALTRWEKPALVYHGRHDFLVPLDAAREHHRLLPQSELVVTEGDHFDVFMRPAAVSPVLAGFLTKVDAGQARTRAASPTDRVAAAARPYDGPVGTAHMGPRLAIEIGTGVVLVVALAGVAWWRRRRRRRQLGATMAGL